MASRYFQHDLDAVKGEEAEPFQHCPRSARSHRLCETLISSRPVSVSECVRSVVRAGRFRFRLFVSHYWQMRRCVDLLAEKERKTLPQKVFRATRPRTSDFPSSYSSARGK